MKRESEKKVLRLIVRKHRNLGMLLFLLSHEKVTQKSYVSNIPTENRGFQWDL